MHEAKMHDVSCGVTLTYDDEHLPEDRQLHHSDFQAFMKRLREHLRKNSRPLVRFFMCGEYGTVNGRPHYHAAIFGYYPEDAVFYRESKKSGGRIYTSKELRGLWGNGDVFVNEVSFEFASYMARYMVKKTSTGKYQEILDVTSGEVYQRANEYARMSLKPGLGASFVEKFGREMFPHDRVKVRGYDSPLPRYYKRMLERYSPLFAAENKAKRLARAERIQYELEEKVRSEGGNLFDDVKRLDVHEKVKLASINHLKREL